MEVLTSLNASQWILIVGAFLTVFITFIVSSLYTQIDSIKKELKEGKDTLRSELNKSSDSLMSSCKHFNRETLDHIKRARVVLSKHRVLFEGPNAPMTLREAVLKEIDAIRASGQTATAARIRDGLMNNINTELEFLVQKDILNSKPLGRTRVYVPNEP